MNTRHPSYDNTHLHHGPINEATMKLTAAFHRIERNAEQLKKRAEDGQTGPDQIDRYNLLKSEHAEGRGHLVRLRRRVLRMRQIANFQRILNDTTQASTQAGRALDGAKQALGLGNHYVIPQSMGE